MTKFSAAACGTRSKEAKFSIGAFGGSKEIMDLYDPTQAGGPRVAPPEDVAASPFGWRRGWGAHAVETERERALVASLRKCSDFGFGSEYRQYGQYR